MLGAGIVEHVLAGKAYNKGMSAHKLTLQALWGLLMPIILAFLSDAHNEYQVELFYITRR